jgi:hypothetical protein
MAVGALIVAIVSALAAVSATLYARRLDKTAGDAVEATREAAAAAKESAAASGRSASAAEAGVALETGRRHSELTPRFRVVVIREGQGVAFPMMSVFLVGPPELGRLDGLTVTIRGNNRRWPTMWQEPQMPEPATPEQLAQGIYGPYRFYPDTHTDAAGRVASREGMQVGDELRFSLDPTSPPPWSSWEQGPWQEWVGTEWVGTELWLRLEARRKGWEPWTLTCEIDSAAEPATVEVPGGPING